MARIAKVLRWVNKGDYATVYVQLEDGLECSVYIGGAVKAIEHNNVIKAYVLPPWTRNNQSRKAITRGKLP